MFNEIELNNHWNRLSEEGMREEWSNLGRIMLGPRRPERADYVEELSVDGWLKSSLRPIPVHMHQDEIEE